MHGEELVEHLGRDEAIVGDGKLDAHQHRFDARNQEENESVPDVHQPDLLVIHCCQPLVHQIQRRTALAGRQRSIDSFDDLSCAHQTTLSSEWLTKLRQIGGDCVQVAIVQMHRRHQATGLERVRIVDPLPQVLRGILNGSGADRIAACQVREIGPESPRRHRSGNGMAVLLRTP